MSETTSDRVGHPLVIAHRGASGDAPENTIAAFDLALAQGADAIGLDVRLSVDGQPMVIRDSTLERTTDGTGTVGERTVRELKRLDAGGWWDPRFRGQRIQTLQEVFERFRDRTRFWIELQCGSDPCQGIEERVASTIEIYEVLERTLVQSFDRRSLAQIRVLNAEIRLGVLIASPPPDSLAHSAAAYDAVCPHASLVTREAIGAARDAGLACYVWTVNEPAQMDQLVEWGVSGIVTDRPAVLRARLRR